MDRAAARGKTPAERPRAGILHGAGRVAARPARAAVLREHQLHARRAQRPRRGRERHRAASRAPPSRARLARHESRRDGGPHPDAARARTRRHARCRDRPGERPHAVHVRRGGGRGCRVRLPRGRPQGLSRAHRTAEPADPDGGTCDRARGEHADPRRRHDPDRHRRARGRDRACDDAAPPPESGVAACARRRRVPAPVRAGTAGDGRRCAVHAGPVRRHRTVRGRLSRPLPRRDPQATRRAGRRAAARRFPARAARVLRCVARHAGCRARACSA